MLQMGALMMHPIPIVHTYISTQPGHPAHIMSPRCYVPRTIRPPNDTSPARKGPHMFHLPALPRGGCTYCSSRHTNVCKTWLASLVVLFTRERSKKSGANFGRGAYHSEVVSCGVQYVTSAGHNMCGTPQVSGQFVYW